MDSLIKTKDIEVAVGIVENLDGQLLVAKRPAHWIGGGYWEFPGGKIEPNEDSRTALARELLEEVGIKVRDCTPLIKITYTYPERKVTLNAWRVHLFEGEAVGLEGQEISWCTPHSLNTLNMLPANRPIVVASQLPDRYLITPNCDDKSLFLSQLERSLTKNSVKLLSLRSKNLNKDDYFELAKEVAVFCEKQGICLLLNNDDLNLAKSIPQAGLHLSSEQLLNISERPLSLDRWIGASCHNAMELQKAEQIGVDFVVLSPVKNSTKPNHIGWDKFGDWVSGANIPVYGLGGLAIDDINKAKALGAQGIAATTALWD